MENVNDTTPNPSMAESPDVSEESVVDKTAENNESGKVISLEDVKAKKENVPETEEEKAMVDSIQEAIEEDMKNPSPKNDEQMTETKLKDMLKMVSDSLKTLEGATKIMEEQWMNEAREFKITDNHMKELGKWNSDHCTKLPEDATEEQRREWDYLNGIDTITIEEIKRIFGDDSPIHGMSEEITKGRVKEVCEAYFGWLMALREYRECHDAYLQLLEEKEDYEIKILKDNAEKEEDPKKKLWMYESINTYYDLKYLAFLKEPLPEKEMKRIVDALTDEKKCTYWLNRTKEKLQQYKVSPRFIMEIAGFEKRFETDYSSINNILLLYFMTICIHSDASDKNDLNNAKTFSMVIALDNVIRNVWKDEKAKSVMDNVEAFLEQVMKYKEDHATE